MRFALAWIAVAASLAAQALPNPKLTPGAIDPAVTQATIHRTVCIAGYTAKVRHVSERLKRKVFADYGIPWSARGRYEVDHLISLENGGSNDLANLWPEAYEPFPGARDKDKVETALKRDLCSGKITLARDQAILRKDWFSEYVLRFGMRRIRAVKAGR